MTSSHEARAALDAQMILDEGHWLVPRLFDQHLELQKPPMFYWLVAILGWLGGGRIDAWAVRLPSALAALGCVLFLYYLGVRSRRPQAGFFAAMILATSVHFTWLAQVGRIDMPLTFAITFALGSFYLGRFEHSCRWYAAGYVGIAYAILLKGPIGAVLPGVVRMAVWVVCERRFEWRSSTLWWGVPLVLILSAPWFLWANWHTHGQLWDVFFWHHNIERGLGGSDALAAHPWWFYVARLWIDLLPWSLAIPLTVFLFARQREAWQDVAATQGLIWFGAITMFLSLMRFKRADYLLPAYPGLAIFLGATAERWWNQIESSQARKTLAWAFGSVSAVCLVSWLAFGVWSLVPVDDARIEAVAKEIRGRTEKPVVFFRAESHLLAYHLGQPVATILEWENLEVWANRPFPVYFVMPEDCAHRWRDHVAAGPLDEVVRLPHGRRERPLVIMRSRGKAAAEP